MSKSRAKGTAFETSLLPALRELDDRVERRALRGAKDCGDFTTLRLEGFAKITVSAKAHRVWRIKSWLRELAGMVKNDKADVGILIPKLVGVADPFEQPVVMSMRQFIYLVGAR